MATRSKDIKCKSCARILATVSSTGLVPAETSEDEGCNTCERFSALHAVMQMADQDWAEVESKRDTLKAKQIARERHKKVHMDFDNWLMGVEASTLQIGEQQDGSNEQNPVEQSRLKNGEEQRQQQGGKRARSDSPTTQQSEEHNLQQERSQQLGNPLFLRPSAKRTRSTASLPERKRLKFSDSVEFRDNYRGSSEYLRTDQAYVRGRHAPPEGTEYLDTSGSGQTFLRFTNMKKVKGGWVEVTEEDRERVKMPAELRKLGASEDITTQEGPGSAPPGERNNNEGGQLDARANRLARRTRNTSSGETAEKISVAEGRSNIITPGGRRKLLSRTSTKVQGPSNEADSIQPTTQSAGEKEMWAEYTAKSVQENGSIELVLDRQETESVQAPSATETACSGQTREAHKAGFNLSGESRDIAAEYDHGSDHKDAGTNGNEWGVVESQRELTQDDLSRVSEDVVDPVVGQHLPNGSSVHDSVPADKDPSNYIQETGEQKQRGSTDNGLTPSTDPIEGGHDKAELDGSNGQATGTRVLEEENKVNEEGFVNKTTPNTPTRDIPTQDKPQQPIIACKAATPVANAPYVRHSPAEPHAPLHAQHTTTAKLRDPPAALEMQVQRVEDSGEQASQ